MTDAALDNFALEYAAHRQAEGRGYSIAELLSLPYLTRRPLAQQWAVRARSFEAFRNFVAEEAARRGAPLAVIDLGAGNGWLSHRLALDGHHSVALDIRNDDVDGLGAAAELASRLPERMKCVVGSFQSIPMEHAEFDVALFNASLHYSTDLAKTLAEATRVVRPGGTIAILDSPFYRTEEQGAAMVAEKLDGAHERFGSRAETLLSLPFIEFLTRERLEAASGALGLHWSRRRVSYPLGYELRPFIAAVAGKRRPSRFDLWRATRP